MRESIRDRVTATIHRHAQLGFNGYPGDRWVCQCGRTWSTGPTTHAEHVTDVLAACELIRVPVEADDAVRAVKESVAAAAREVASDLGCIGLPEHGRIADAFEKFADLVWIRSTTTTTTDWS